MCISMLDYNDIRRESMRVKIIDNNIDKILKSVDLKDDRTVSIDFNTAVMDRIKVDTNSKIEDLNDNIFLRFMFGSAAVAAASIMFFYFSSSMSSKITFEEHMVVASVLSLL